MGDAAVEKFVDTLVSSERYLKMIESLDRKLSHLDMTYRERSNSVLKYLNEILRLIKKSSSEALESALRTVKLDLDNMKQTLSERIDDQPAPKTRGKFIIICYSMYL